MRPKIIGIPCRDEHSHNGHHIGSPPLKCVLHCNFPAILVHDGYKCTEETYVPLAVSP